MRRGIALIVFLAVTYAVTMLEAERLSANWLVGLQLLLALIGFAAVAWAFVPDRKRSG